MKLRHKFGVLALIYVASLSANLIMSGWCIVTYFQSAFFDVQSTFVRQTQIEQLRVRLLGMRERLALAGAFAESAALPPDLERVRADAAGLRVDANETETALWRRFESELAAAVQAPDGPGFQRCDHWLARISAQITATRQAQIDAAAATQQKVVTILIVNTVCGAALCLAGLMLVRRWVLLPVADLRSAAHEISQGNFDHRIAPRSQDELGQLAGEVNDMSATIVAMQAKLVAQERQAAEGELFQRVAHNIRNPLAGIRGLAEAANRAEAPAGEIDEYHRRIIVSVDRLEKWLRDVQQSVAPMSINPQPTDMRELIDNVRHVLAPMAERSGVGIVVSIDPATRYVLVDALHFEQAMVALMTNAVQASRSGQTVRVRVGPAGDTPDQWCVTVEDDGVGISQDLRTKVFLPHFTTRRDGNGIGLAMAAKVVHTHGGRITLESAPGAGSRFAAFMPGRTDDRDER
jgi:signal transduction histidine kinase